MPHVDFSEQPIAPKAAHGSLLMHSPPSPRLSRAFAILCHHLWPSMRPNPWWSGEATRCIWASHVAAEVLQRLGFNAAVVSAAVFALPHDADTGERTEGGVGIGMPTPTHPGHHAAVLVEDSDGPVLLETSLFQARRRRFCAIPDMALAQTTPVVAARLAEIGVGERTGSEVAASWLMEKPCPEGGMLELSWLVWNGAPNWLGCGDSRRERAVAVADRIFRVAASPLSACRNLAA